MKIEVLGSGCTKCQKLMGLLKEAVNELGSEAEILKVDDYKTIVAYGVMATPALVINGNVKVYGKIPSYDEIKNIIKKTDQ